MNPRSPLQHLLFGGEAGVWHQLNTHILDPWLSRALDPVHGGYHQNFAADWSKMPDSGRTLVYQSRLLWSAAFLAEFRPDESVLAYCDYGLRQLDRHADPAGGFFHELSLEGSPTSRSLIEKHGYSNSFAVFALARLARATRSAEALRLAMHGFDWLVSVLKDKEHGGYFECVDPTGEPILAPHHGYQKDQIANRYGFKSMNTHIHILEAFHELFLATRSLEVRSHLDEVFLVVRDKVTHPDGYTHYYCLPDWTPASEIDSYGHNTETAFLLLESSETLGRADHAETEALAIRIVDRQLERGEDHEHGGFFYEGLLGGTVTHTHKSWWTQAESLNTLHFLDARFGDSTEVYRDAAVRTWKFIEQFHLDAVHGGWIPLLSADGSTDLARIKSDAWTEGYHQGRCLMGFLSH